ncbi:BTB/POZ domain-containing protein KCTD12-like [Symsagittifera roscoffensis]|uniref:BTB/POZ domain-containing protein KCTD12-like n=1 Tax=Symsagittifera roscoffensis TaxID=84072 RepID=UPI00307CB4B1
MGLEEDRSKSSASHNGSESESAAPNPNKDETTGETLDIAGTQFPSVVELNVGGQVYTTALSTLTRENTSLLGIIFSGKSKTPPLRDTRGRYFLDRDGHLFRFILDYLRNTKLVLPEEFPEKDRLQVEADYYRLPGLVESIRRARGGGANREKDQSTGGAQSRGGTQQHEASNKGGKVAGNNSNQSMYDTNQGGGVGSTGDSSDGFITLGYRGTFAFGRDGMADVQFRKLMRIIVCGKVSLCREVFKETLNESRDPDRGQGDRYTSRFFLKHNFLEQAFDMLQQGGFTMSASCATAANGMNQSGNPEQESEENRWLHYNEFIFQRSGSN